MFLNPQEKMKSKTFLNVEHTIILHIYTAQIQLINFKKINLNQQNAVNNIGKYLMNEKFNSTHTKNRKLSSKYILV